MTQLISWFCISYASGHIKSKISDNFPPKQRKVHFAKKEQNKTWATLYQFTPLNFIFGNMGLWMPQIWDHAVGTEVFTKPTMSALKVISYLRGSHLQPDLAFQIQTPAFLHMYKHHEQFLDLVTSLGSTTWQYLTDLLGFYGADYSSVTLSLPALVKSTLVSMNS